MRKQLFELGQKVFCFRINKGAVVEGEGIIMMAEINKAGYIQYTVKIKQETAEKDWIVNHASIATTKEEIQEKMQAYIQYNKESQERYIKKFGAPEFNNKDLEI